MRWKRTRRTPARHTQSRPESPWVLLLTDVGRPLVTVIVLVLCAPGEHLLGVMAGWSSWLAWGVAALFAAYAGIAAVVAARRKGRPGARAALIGSLTALALAMASQPVAHLYARGVWVADPHDTVWLIVAVSCVPAPVLAHLLHIAATPTRREDPEEEPAEEPAQALSSPPQQPQITAAPVYLTTAEVMSTLGVSRATLGRYTAQGLLTPSIVDPRRGNLFEQAHVDALTP